MGERRLAERASELVEVGAGVQSDEHREERQAPGVPLLQAPRGEDPEER